MKLQKYHRWFLFVAFAMAALSYRVQAGEECWTNLYDAVTGAGQTLGVTSTALYGNGSGESGTADFLFNGIIYAQGTGARAQRVLFLQRAEGNPSVTVTLTNDAAFATGQRVVLRRVDLFPVTYSNNAKKRMPTEYKVYGIDDDYEEIELLHATNLEYPNLGENAASNEFYSVAVPAAASETGFRQYRLEFLSSPAMTGAAAGAIVVSFMEIRLQVELVTPDPLQEELYGEQNFSQKIRDAGYAVLSYIGNQNNYGSYGAHNLFDGVTFSASSDSVRWLGLIHNANGCYAEIKLPDACWPGDLFYLKNFKVWSLTCSGNELRRAPTAWKILGTADANAAEVWKATDDTGWTEIEARSGLDWSVISTTYSTRGMNSLGKMTPTASGAGYRAFRFRPLASAATAEGETGIDVGLNELDLIGLPVNPKGTLRVRATVKGCDFGTHPSDGALIEAAMTVTAPEYVTCGTKSYCVTGYRVETFDYVKGAWEVGSSVASRTYDYVPEADVSKRLVWELSVLGSRLDASLADGGNERITVEPQQDFYAPDDVVTITAYPNADVLEEAGGATNKFRSAFVRWEGDTNGIADVTSPTITVQVGEGRRLIPVFRRDWLAYQYNFENEGGTGNEWRMRDGNFELRLSYNEFIKGRLWFANNTWLISGRGSFDLDTKIIRSSTGEQITITEMYLLQLGSDKARRADFTRVVLPKTLTLCSASTFRDQTNLVEAVVDCPNMTQIKCYLFTRDINLSRLVLKLPKLQCIDCDYSFFNVPMDETDANDWQLDSLAELTKVGNQRRFMLSEYSWESKTHDYGVRGTLTLPAIQRIGDFDFASQRHITNLVLGTRKGSLQYIGGAAFISCAALESMTIGCTGSLTVDDEAFSYCPNLKDITFVKYVPPAAAIDQMLTNCTATARANIYVPRRAAWDGFLQPIDAVLDPNPPVGAIGVYQTGAGVRKAWVFRKASPLDPKGFLVHIE